MEDQTNASPYNHRKVASMPGTGEKSITAHTLNSRAN